MELCPSSYCSSSAALTSMHSRQHIGLPSAVCWPYKHYLNILLALDSRSDHRHNELGPLSVGESSA